MPVTHTVAKSCTQNIDSYALAFLIAVCQYIDMVLQTLYHIFAYSSYALLYQNAFGLDVNTETGKS